MMGLKQRYGWLLAAALLVAALGTVVAGCGGGSSSSSGSSTTESESEPSGGSSSAEGEEGETTNAALENASYVGAGETGLGIRPAGGAAQAKAEKAGTSVGEKAGEAKLPPLKVGIISFLNGIESSDRLTDTATYAMAQLGWTSTVCDGKGTPSEFVACGNSLLAEGVDAIVDVAIEPGQIASVLKKANEKGVPVVQAAGGTVPLGELSGSFGPSEEKSGEILATALIEKLEELNEPVEIAVHNFPALWGADRTKALEKDLEGNSNITIGDEVETDASNLAGFTRSTVTTELTQNPNLKAFWFAYDTAGQIAGQTIASKYPGKQFPERPLVATFHGDLGTIALMHQGAIDMASDVNYDAGMWVAIDQLAQYFGREQKIVTEPNPKYPIVGEPYTYQILTSENLPEEGEYAAPKWDIPSYFIAKWKSEFGM
jgi:ABC-type sugar transport system substrate-binding protein